MYAVSDNYKQHIADSTVRKSHAKIIVNGVTYDGQKLKKYPSISCEADFIGSFPAKCCTFEIYNIPEDLVGNEIEVYRGLEIDGVIEWVPMGLFTAAADGVKTSSTGDYVTYTGYDRAMRFDVEYEALDITYPTTIGVFAQEMAFRRGLDFDTTPFPCCDIILDGPPNVPTGTTEREVIRQLAELGGANAWVSRAGALCISQPRETTEQICKLKYTSLSSKENVFGGINTVVLGKADYDDDIVYQDAAAVAADGVIEWRLENNMFAEVDRAAFAEYIGDSYIIGLSFTPFEVSGFVDDWYLDLFDVVQIEDKNGDYFSTVILSYTTTDRIKSTVGAGVPEEMHTNYEIAGTTKKKLTYVALQVDHIKNQIQSIAADVTEIDGNVTTMQSQVTQNAEAIELKVSYGDVISSINQSAETISIDASKINLTGYITASDLSATGQTVIHGGRIDTDTLYVKHLSGADGDFSGNLSGDTCYFNNLVARSGGSLQIGNWDFLDDGLEYSGGVFDLEYSGGIAKVSGTVPMQVGPYANGVTNSLTLYGTTITFGVSTSNYQAVMDSNSSYTEICFRPKNNNTGNIGTSSYRWDTGHFRNLHIYNTLSIASISATGQISAGSFKTDGNLTAETVNAGSAARVSGTMVIGDATSSQPSNGLRITNLASAVDSSAYASDKVMTAGNSTGTLYKTGVPLSRLYDVVGTSTAKRKHNIAPLGADYDIFDLLKPIQFNFNNTGEKGLGLLAEDLEILAPDLCYYDDDGVLEGIKYNSIIALIIREVQRLNEKLKGA